MAPAPVGVPGTRQTGRHPDTLVGAAGRPPASAGSEAAADRVTGACPRSRNAPSEAGRPAGGAAVIDDPSAREYRSFPPQHLVDAASGLH